MHKAQLVLGHFNLDFPFPILSREVVNSIMLTTTHILVLYFADIPINDITDKYSQSNIVYFFNKFLLKFDYKTNLVSLYCQ